MSHVNIILAGDHACILKGRMYKGSTLKLKCSDMVKGIPPILNLI